MQSTRPSAAFCFFRRRGGMGKSSRGEVCLQRLVLFETADAENAETNHMNADDFRDYMLALPLQSQ
jgi:hypothetical protein